MVAHPVSHKVFSTRAAVRDNRCAPTNKEDKRTSRWLELRIYTTMTRHTKTTLCRCLHAAGDYLLRRCKSEESEEEWSSLFLVHW